MDQDLLKFIMEDIQFIDIMCEDIITESSRDGFYDTNGKWNSLIRKGGKNFRERVEIVLVNGDSVFISKRPDGTYKIPGGSTEKDKTDVEQVIAECQEEAYMTPTNIRYFTSYTVEYNDKNPMPKWINNDKYPIKYNGYIAKVYVGEYSSEYTEYVDILDRDESVRSGKFIPIKDAIKFMRPEHKKALQMVYKK